MKAFVDAYALIKHFEGLRLRAYLDGGGVPTIGYGHTGRVVHLGLVITSEEAMSFLLDDVEKVEDFLNDRMKLELKPHEFDALVSWVYNVGTYQAQQSTLMRKLKEGKMQEAADELLRWNKDRVKGKMVPVAGLTRRREAERHLFLTGELLSLQ